MLDAWALLEWHVLHVPVLSVDADSSRLECKHAAESRLLNRPLVISLRSKQLPMQPMEQMFDGSANDSPLGQWLPGRWMPDILTWPQLGC